MRKYPVGMVLGGYYDWGNGTSSYDQGTFGGYWSSFAYTGATRAYLLRLYGIDSTVYPAADSNKRVGRSLRCLGKNQNRQKIIRQKEMFEILPPPNRWPFWRIPNSLQ